LQSFQYYNQLDSRNCGPTCLRIVAKLYGKSYSLQALREKSFITREGVSLFGISETAKGIGFRTTGVSLNWKQLVEEAPMLCIVHWKQNHFVVVYSIKGKSTNLLFKKVTSSVLILVADPALGLIKYTKEEYLTGSLTE